MTLGEAALGKLLEAATSSFLTGREAARSTRVSVDYREARSSLLSHIQSLRNWCESVTLLTLLHDKSLRESFVELSLDIGLRRSEKRVGAGGTFRINDVYQRTESAVLLGRPGAGKTTSLQRIAMSAIDDWDTGKGGVPILVRLRDLGSSQSLAKHVLAILGVVVLTPERMAQDIVATWGRRVLIHYLEQISAILLVDGLDETPYSQRDRVEEDLRQIALFPGNHRLFLTCRTAEYAAPLSKVQAYTILPLSEAQVADFASRWLGNRASAFTEAVRRNPYAGAEVVPLALAHLCAIYERDGELPPRPIEVYEQIVSLLVEEWDRQRSVVRTSKYAGFSWRKKERFLQAVAFHLAINGRKGSFRDRDLELVYEEIAPEFNLPEDEARAVIREIESHTGLVHEVGHRQFDFVHLVIQEYLAAMYAHRRVNAVTRLMPAFPNEMALVIAHSVEPEKHLELALNEALRHHAGANGAFLMSFLSRLAVERPTWKATPRLGWSVLAFLDLFSRYFRALDKTDTLRVPEESLHILKDSAVASAVAMAIGEAEVYPERFAFRLVPRDLRSVPPSLLDFLKQRDESGLRVIRSEMQIAALFA